MSWGRTLAGLSAGSTDCSPNTSCTTSRRLAQAHFIARWSDISDRRSMARTDRLLVRSTGGTWAEPFVGRPLLLEISQRRHAAVWRHMVDDLRQHSRELAQQFLLAHARALRQFGKHILTKRRSELSGRHRFIRPVADPGIDLRRHAPCAELANEIRKAAENAAGWRVCWHRLPRRWNRHGRRGRRR